jgi:hypothetical protein
MARSPRPASSASTVRRTSRRSGGPSARRRASVMAGAVGRPVEIRAYAERIEVRQNGQVVAEHRVVHWARTNGATMDDLRTRQDGLRSVALPASALAQAGGAPERRAVQGLAAAGRARARAPQAPRRAGRRSADGRHPRRRARRRAGGGRSGLRRGALRGRPFGGRDPQHPGAPPRAATARCDRHPRGVVPEARLRRDASPTSRAPTALATTA